MNEVGDLRLVELNIFSLKRYNIKNVVVLVFNCFFCKRMTFTSSEIKGLIISC